MLMTRLCSWPVGLGGGLGPSVGCFRILSGDKKGQTFGYWDSGSCPALSRF